MVLETHFHGHWVIGHSLQNKKENATDFVHPWVGCKAAKMVVNLVYLYLGIFQSLWGKSILMDGFVADLSLVPLKPLLRWNVEIWCCYALHIKILQWASHPLGSTGCVWLEYFYLRGCPVYTTDIKCMRSNDRQRFNSSHQPFRYTRRSRYRNAQLAMEQVRSPCLSASSCALLQ